MNNYKIIIKEQRPMLQGAVAHLGGRENEELEIPGSKPRCGIFFRYHLFYRVGR